MTRARHLRLTVAALVVGVALLLCACSANNSSGAAQAAGPSGSASGAAFTQPASVLMPVISEDSPSIDISHVNDGYVVAHLSSASRLKFQVIHDNITYNYDLPNDNTPTVYPLNTGSGTYDFRIMKHVSGNDYLPSDTVQAEVTLTSEFAPFLIPNQYCWYTPESACVAKARELTASAENQGEALRAVCEYIMQNISYDTAKAARLSGTTGFVPSPDETLSTGSGVCFDYASLGAAMLRSMGIPTKVITGYVSPGDLYHAWIMVYVDGTWQTGEFSVSADEWSRVDLTFMASGNTDYTGDGTSYTDRYVY